jgi:phosphate transport system substrate-binding protein
MTKEVRFMRWHKLLALTARRFFVAPWWLPVLIIAGTLMTTLPLWRSLLVNARPWTEQRIQSDVVPVKNPLTPNIESSSGHLVFAGSGVNLQIIRLLAEAFRKSHPDEFKKIDVPATIGSTGAIQAAADGAIAVGLISRPLKEQEKKLGLTVVPYAQTAIAIATHPSVAEDGITSSELIQIYKGTKSHWQDGQQIVVLSREEGDSSILVLEKKIPRFKEMFADSNHAKFWSTLYKDQDMERVLARTPYTIGFVDTGTITAERVSSIKVLKFNSVSPTPENVSSGKYPLVKNLAFVFRKDRLPANAKAFLNFIHSREGEKILRANAYLPVE